MTNFTDFDDFDIKEQFKLFLENVEILNKSEDTRRSLQNILKNCTRNISSTSDLTFTEEQFKILEGLYRALYNFVIPAVCVFGFFGNILNVIVFSKKKMCKTLDDIEYCTTIFLIALAISDMMFCLCTFPQAFDSRANVYEKTDFMVYYKMYSNFAISTFILSSTLLTVLTAVMRYTAICHPFHSRQFISFRKTVTAILSLFLFSVVFNSPYIWRFKMTPSECQPSNYVKLDTGNLFTKPNFVYIHKLLWAIIGNFIPLLLLLYCNIRLVKALHESQKLRLLHSRDNAGCLSAHRRINITLIAIIILFFILVAPSEITKFIYFSHSKTGMGRQSFAYILVSMITNALQCINFSVNFVLYYVIIAPFRKTIHEFVCVLLTRRGTRDSTNSPRQTCIVLTHKEQRRALI